MVRKVDSELSLTIRAVDKATEPLKLVNAQIALLEAPRKLAEASKRLAGLRSTSAPVFDSLRTVGTAFSGVGSAAARLGAQLAGAFTIGGVALFGFVKHAVEAGDQIGEVADRVGLTVDAYASLRHAAAQADVEQEAFNTALDKLIKNMGEMKSGKGGEFLAFLNKISPTFAKQMKGAKSTEDALALLTDAFAKIEDPAKRAVLASHAFGKSGLQMGVFLSQGSAAIQAQQRRYLELAGSQEKFARGAGDLDNVMRETGVAFEGVRNVLGGALFPAFTEVAKAVTSFLVANRDGIGRWANESAAAIKGWIDGGGLQRVGALLERLGRGVVWLTDTFGPVNVAIAAAAASIGGPWILSLTTATSALWGFGAALVASPAGPFVLAGAAIAAVAWTIYDNWEPISAFFKDLWADVGSYFHGGYEQIAGLLTLDFDRVMNGWAESLRGLKEVFMDFTRIHAQIPVIGALSQKIVEAVDGPGPRGTIPRIAPEGILSQGPGGEARVKVDFANMPAGARVSTDPKSTAALDLSLGYSMVGP